MLELLNLFYYNLFDKNSSLIINSKRFYFISLCKYKNYFLIYKIFKDFFLKIFSLNFKPLIPFGHYKDKDFILIYKIIRENFLLKMNFIILRIIFRKYLHI